MPSGIPITPEQLDEAIRLQNRFWTQDRIAEKLGLNPQSLCRAMGRHNRRAMARLAKRTAAEKAKQVRQLETVASEAFEAWLHSKTPRETEKVSGSDGEDSGTFTTLETSTHHCDSSLLNQARGALADIRKILGLDAAEKIEVSDRDYGIDLSDPDTPSQPPDATPA